MLDIVSNGGTVQSDDEIIAELSQKLADCQYAGIKALESYGIVQKQLTQTQKYLQQIESKYRAVLIFNHVLSLVILGDCYLMGASMILKENDLPDDIIQSLGEVS